MKKKMLGNETKKPYINPILDLYTYRGACADVIMVSTQYGVDQYWDGRTLPDDPFGI